MKTAYIIHEFNFKRLKMAIKNISCKKKRYGQAATWLNLLYAAGKKSDTKGPIRGPYLHETSRSGESMQTKSRQWLPRAGTAGRGREQQLMGPGFLFGGDKNVLTLMRWWCISQCEYIKTPESMTHFKCCTVSDVNYISKKLLKGKFRCNVAGHQACIWSSSQWTEREPQRPSLLWGRPAAWSCAREGQSACCPGWDGCSFKGHRHGSKRRWDSLKWNLSQMTSGF